MVILRRGPVPNTAVGTEALGSWRTYLRAEGTDGILAGLGRDTAGNGRRKEEGSRRVSRKASNEPVDGIGSSAAIGTFACPAMRSVRLIEANASRAVYRLV